MQLDLFSEKPSAPERDESLVLSFEIKHSNVQIIVRRNDDGTWGFATHDQYYGYCGHGGPIWGHYASFAAALLLALNRIKKNADHILIDRSSCCGDSHRRFANSVLAWVADRFDEYDLHADQQVAA